MHLIRISGRGGKNDRPTERMPHQSRRPRLLLQKDREGIDLPVKIDKTGL